MLEIRPLHTSDTALYRFMEELLTSAFPAGEYRDLQQLRTLTDRSERFRNHVVLDGPTPVGLVSWWEFDAFRYVEHLAVAPTCRNAGYGHRIVERLCESSPMPVVLEVELPADELAARRIGFYRREGFVLWENDYVQPPYRPGDPPLPMYLMVHGPLDADRDFETVRQTIHRAVYGYPTPESTGK